MALQRRLLATSVDAGIALTLSAISAVPLGQWCAQRAVLALAIDDPSSWWRGPLPLVLGILGTVVYSLPFTILAVGASRLAFGRTPGEALAATAPRRDRRRVNWLDDYAPALLLAIALGIGRLRATEIVLVLVGLWILLRIWRLLSGSVRDQRV